MARFRSSKSESGARGDVECMQDVLNKAGCGAGDGTVTVAANQGLPHAVELFRWV